MIIVSFKADVVGDHVLDDLGMLSEAHLFMFLSKRRLLFPVDPTTLTLEPMCGEIATIARFAPPEVEPVALPIGAPVDNALPEVAPSCRHSWMSLHLSPLLQRPC